MSELETVEIRRDGGAMTIALNRPDTLNAWNAQLGVDLMAAVREAAEDDDVRALCLTGNGRAFSSGADLRDTTTATMRDNGRPDLSAVLRDRYNPIITAIRELEKPVVAAVNGPAVGIGLSLALSADLVVARESAYFLLAFVNIGLAPDGGASATVAARIGLTRASEMAMLGEKIPARQAAEWGLINSAHADDEFDAHVESLLARLAAGPTRAHAAIKRQLNAWMLRGFADQLELEAIVQNEMADSDDFVAGAMGFVSGKPATFAGR
ncbi:MAG: enoyl-CoA hydratase-related protein [Baekduia sp.]